MANLTPDALMAALGAVHKSGVNTDPSTGTPYDQGAGGGAGDPAAAGGQTDPNAPPDQSGGAQGGAEQAIWDAFPSTDPSQIDQLASQASGAQGPDLEGLIQSFYAQVHQDKQDFEQRQQMNEERFWQALGGGEAGAPAQSTAPPQGADAAAPPAVGGASVGY